MKANLGDRIYYAISCEMDALFEFEEFTLETTYEQFKSYIYNQSDEYEVYEGDCVIFVTRDMLNEVFEKKDKQLRRQFNKNVKYYKNN
ncbi:MAG: hypothetical protein J6S67_14335 [Methanobrevibacter sp.]|nr:hypothetical protein [Methanobrevibacter sp.]